MAWTKNTTTQHTCGTPMFGHKTPGCPRCDDAGTASTRDDECAAVLRDIILGCELMQQPGMRLTGSFASFVAEVKRVAQAAVQR